MRNGPVDGRGTTPRGNSDACKFMHPRRGAASTAAGKIRPYAMTSATSGARSRSHSSKFPVFTFSGWCTSSSSSSAASLTAGGCSLSPRPAGRSGWQTTPTISAISASDRSAGTAIAGVPKNTARTAGVYQKRLTHAARRRQAALKAARLSHGAGVGDAKGLACQIGVVRFLNCTETAPFRAAPKA